MAAGGQFQSCVELSDTDRANISIPKLTQPAPRIE